MTDSRPRLPLHLSAIIQISVLIFSSFLFSCSSSSQSDNLSHASAVPPDFRVVTGEGGGFSGLWNGWAIGPRDSVSSWKGRDFGENATFTGRLRPDSLAALWMAVDASHLLDSASNAGATNFTRTLLLRAKGTERKLSWAPGTKTSAAEVLYFRCQTAAARATGQ